VGAFAVPVFASLAARMSAVLAERVAADSRRRRHRRNRLIPRLAAAT
jgi:hypothetical protein